MHRPVRQCANAYNNTHIHTHAQVALALENFFLVCIQPDEKAASTMRALVAVKLMMAEEVKRKVV
jgi:hypothetical protein